MLYHAGELAAQEKAGAQIGAERNGRAIATAIVPGAIPFIEKQPMIVVASQDSSGSLHSSVISGEPGFITVLNPVTIQLNLNLINSNPHDPFWNNIKKHVKIGMLFIELSSRKRYRVNGITEINDQYVNILIEQAYPNCPKFIQRRHVLRSDKPVYNQTARTGTSLTPDLFELIRKADTFFVGSADDAGNLDASHRGGLPGFVMIEPDGSLLIPDYSGNSMFNTLGNFLKNPKAGLVFPDFEKHQTLHLSGSVEVFWNRDDVELASGGTGRFWKFIPDKWVLMENLKGYEWRFVDYSPLNPNLR